MRSKFSHITLVLFALVCVTLSGVEANAQDLDKKVSIEADKKPLSEFLNDLSNLAQFSIAYSTDVVKDHKVTLSAKDEPIKAILEKALKDTNLTWTIVARGLMIHQKKNSNESGNPERIVTGEVTGTVRDKAGSAIPGVSVFVKGTTTGTTTDAQGRYSIDLPAALSGAEGSGGHILVFSFIGYKTTEEVVGARLVVDLTLEEDTKVLDEVVINGGYYETSDKLKTGSIVKVDAKDIERQPVTSPLIALQGRVAGLDITPNTGTPGNAPIIRIRGVNSLRNGEGDLNGNYPLYVIDGVPIISTPVNSFGLGSTNSLTRGGYDPLSTINPSNIVSIEVLKDGDATAIYGSRGANGVILITTKRDTKNLDRANLDISFYTGIGQISRRIDLLNTEDYLEMRREGFRNDGIEPGEGQAVDEDLLLWDTTRYTDWQKVLLGSTSRVSDITAGLSSGNRNTTFNFNVGYHKETLVTPGDFGYQRATGNLIISHTSTNRKFQATISTNYGLDISDLFNGDLVNAALMLPPNAPKIYDENGQLNWEIHDLGNGRIGSTWLNPFAYMKQTQETTTRNFLSNAKISYEFLPGLLASVSVGYTDLSNSERTKNPVSSRQPYASEREYGIANFTDTRRGTWIIEPKISFSRKYENNALDIIFGTTWQTSNASLTTLNGSNYVSDALLGSLRGAGKILVFNDNTSEYKYFSMYSRVGYNLNQKYLVNLTARLDGSSRFGPDNRFAGFWSIGTGWIFTEENFVKNHFSFLNFGKLRASYGTTGSDNIGDYGYYNLYDVISERYQGSPGFVPKSLYNPDFAWEVTNKLEAAIELSFFNSLLNAEVNWYHNRSSNQLINYTLPATAGFPSVLENFEATVQNTGWEVMLRGDMLNSNNWRWTASVNFTLPDNKLIEFRGIDDSPYSTIYKVGEPLSIKNLYTVNGVNPETGLYNIVDKNDDGIISDLDRTLRNTTYKRFYGGFGSTVQYKAFEVSLFFQFTSQKSERYLPSMPGMRSYNQPVTVLERWQEIGDRTNIQRFATGGDPYSDFVYMTQSNLNVTNGSFVRLKTVTLNFNFPSKWLDHIRLKQGKIFLQGQNLFTITEYDGLDPETGSSLPPLRMITAGVQLQF